MTSPVFLTPLGIEAAAVRRGVRQASIERVGMGPVKATASRLRIAKSVLPASPLLLIGLGGGLVDGATAGDVIVGSSVQLLGTDQSLELHDSIRIAAALDRAGISATIAPIVSSPRMLHGAAARSAAATRGAAVVDMESYWCASLAGSHTFSVCRVLSDVPGQELWSFRTPVALLRALQVIGSVARTIHHLPVTSFHSRSVEEADR